MEIRLLFPPTPSTVSAAIAAHEHAVARLYRAKGRPGEIPIAVLAADHAMASKLIDPGDDFDVVERLSAEHWPGALTVVAFASDHAKPCFHQGFAKRSDDRRASARQRVLPSVGGCGRSLGRYVGQSSRQPDPERTPARRLRNWPE